MRGTGGGDRWVWMIPLTALTGLLYVEATAMCPAAVKKVGSPLKCVLQPCDTLLNPMCFSALFKDCEAGPTLTKWSNVASVCAGVTMGKLVTLSGFSKCNEDVSQSGHYWVAECPGLVISTTTMSTRASSTTTITSTPQNKETTTTVQPSTTTVTQSESSTPTTTPTSSSTTTPTTMTASTATNTSPTSTRLSDTPLSLISSTPTDGTTTKSSSTYETSSSNHNTLFSSIISIEPTQSPSVGTKPTYVSSHKTTPSTQDTHFLPPVSTESTHTPFTTITDSSSITRSSLRLTTKNVNSTEVFSTAPKQTNTSVTPSSTSHQTISSSHNSPTSVQTSRHPGQKSSSSEFHSTTNEDNDHWKQVQTTVIVVGVVAVVMLILIAAVLAFGIRQINRTLKKAIQTPTTEPDHQRQTGHGRMTVFTDSGHYNLALPDELACIDETMFGVRASNRNANCRNDAIADGNCRPNYSESSQPEPETGLQEHGHTRATENHYAPLPDVQERYTGRNDTSLNSLSRLENSRTNLIPQNVTDPTYAVVNRDTCT